MPNEDDELQALKRRVDSLEMTCAFQERALSQVDEVVRKFADRVEGLEADLRRLRSAADQEPLGPQNDPPPHYA